MHILRALVENQVMINNSKTSLCSQGTFVLHPWFFFRCATCSRSGTVVSLWVIVSDTHLIHRVSLVCVIYLVYLPLVTSFTSVILKHRFVTSVKMCHICQIICMHILSLFSMVWNIPCPRSTESKQALNPFDHPSFVRTRSLACWISSFSLPTSFWQKLNVSSQLILYAGSQWMHHPR